jgi:hypothetical protein
MSQYWVAIHLPDNFNPSASDAAVMGRDIDALNEEMVAAGVRVFVGGLTPVREAKSLRAQPDGKVLTTDGPYLETKEHIGGFWVLEVATWTMHWRGGARPRSPAGRRWKCARLEYPTETTQRHLTTLPAAPGGRPQFKKNQIGLERNSVMRKVNVVEFVSLDGVIQSPGGAKEDTSGGFAYGGWIGPHTDTVSSTAMKKQMSMPFDLLIGRKPLRPGHNSGRNIPTFGRASRQRREIRSHISRHHRRKQWNLLHRPRLGRLHRRRQPKRVGTPRRSARRLRRM